MCLREVLDLYPLLDTPSACGEAVAEYMRQNGAEDVRVTQVVGEKGSTDFISIKIKGAESGAAPTLGIIGRLGGIGARPKQIGFVSDGDGALAALAAALKLVRSRQAGDLLPGDVIVNTHICPHAPTIPHDPVPFMSSPVDMATMNRHEVDPAMDAIISIDTTKGNRILNARGIAISPTVKEGYILPVSSDLVSLVEQVTGEPARVLPLSTQDITPYGNGLFHINSILQPATATKAPVVGLAITAAVPVAGCATGASHEVDIALAARFSVEAAKAFTRGLVQFYDKEQFALLVKLYGSANHLQTLGEK